MVLNTDRRTVHLSAFPDLVVIYLGMRVNELRGLKTVFRFGPKIAKSAAEQPEGLLSARKHTVLRRASPRRDTPVLAGLRIPGEVGTLVAAQGVVGELRARHGWYGLLARTVLQARRDGGGLPRYGRSPPRLPETSRPPSPRGAPCSRPGVA